MKLPSMAAWKTLVLVPLLVANAQKSYKVAECNDLFDIPYPLSGATEIEFTASPVSKGGRSCRLHSMEFRSLNLTKTRLAF